MKKLLILFLLSSFAYSLTLDDIETPKPIQGRLANTDKVEVTLVNTSVNEEKAKNITLKKEEEKKEEVISAQTKEETKINSNFADLSLKKLADDISYELDMDSNKINSDLAILWAATTENSETMKYTIYKLSNPDEDKPNDSTIKKIIKPIAKFSSVAGASFAGDPYLATGALIGGGLLNAFMKDDKEYNYNFSKVSDTDMVLLIRKIDDLQKKLLDLYVDYRTKQELARLTKENYEKREAIYSASQNKSREELVIADVYYRNAKVSATRAMDDYLTSRAILENLVGKDALNKIEQD
ncbi:MAG: hypothetical protein IJ877_01405 [Candidatus Gastranaerophilales bacterium]|nr:hypothetical protein [Candidatus Gastranaerophilales bacterium]